MGLVGDEYGNYLRTAAGQLLPCVQGIAAVVAGTDQQHHTGAVREAQELADVNGQAGRGALHQGGFREPRHQLPLGLADLRDGVGAAHSQPSSTTTAEAMPASWLNDR